VAHRLNIRWKYNGVEETRLLPIAAYLHACRLGYRVYPTGNLFTE